MTEAPVSWSANQPDAHAWVVLCDGKPIGNCWRANVAERWAEVAMFGPTGVVLPGRDGAPLCARYSGKVEIKRRPGSTAE